MKRDGIYGVLIGLVITFFTAFLYLCPNEEMVMNKLIINLQKAYQFNWTPMTGFLFMVMSEIILWESRNNNNLIKAKNKLIHNLIARIIHSNIGIKYFSYRGYECQTKVLN